MATTKIANTELPRASSPNRWGCRTSTLHHRHVANVLAVIDELASAHRESAGGEMSNALNTMLERIDWKLVPVDAIKQAVKTILMAAPATEARDVSDEADEERTYLAQIRADMARGAEVVQ